MSAEHMTPEEVLDVAAWLPDGALVEHAIVVVQLRVVDELGDVSFPKLLWRRDTHAGIWIHLGMLSSVDVDCRWSLSPGHYITQDGNE